MRKTALFLFVFLVGFLCFPQGIFAKLSSCGANIDNHQVSINSSTDVTVEITNTDDSGTRMAWMRITSPSSSLTISGNGSSMTYSGFDAGYNSPMNQPMTVESGGTADSAKNWVVEASDDSNGGDPTTCTGDLSMSIIDNSANLPPSISSITLSGVTSSSVTISWTTSADSTSELDYGPDSSYGSAQTDSNSTTSHSFTISSLNASTTYHFNIKATGANGTTESGDNTFATSEPGATPAPAQTITKTLAPTPLPTAVPDRIPPVVSLSTDFKKPYQKAPKITGVATDNKTVSSAYYSLDNGKNWLPVDNISAGKSAYFSFTPGDLEDGNYQIKVKALDTSGNAGYSRAYEMVIDRLPPQIGGTFFSIGPLALLPNEDGIILGLEGLNQKMTFSAVGGPTVIDLILNDQRYSASKNQNNGLWSNSFNLTKQGIYKFRAHSIDGAKNETDKNLSSILVLPAGKVVDMSDKLPVKGVNVSVFVFDNITQSYVLWDGKSYLQNNPQATDKEGKYRLYLPAGKYYLQIQANKYKTLKTAIFTLEKSTFINTDFSLEKAPSMQIGFLTFTLPTFNQTQVEVQFQKPQVEDEVIIKNDLVNKDFPTISLDAEDNKIIIHSLGSKKLAVSFLNTWLPQAAEQLRILDLLSTQEQVPVLVIVPQESVSKVNIFKKSGGYKVDMIADPDGILVTKLNLRSLPQHFFLDKKDLDKQPIIKQIKNGLLSRETILEALSNY
jgi:hypothetical protein